MNSHPASAQSPLQALAARSKKRRNDSSEEDLAQLPDLLSQLSISKRVCKEHSRDKFKIGSTITAATGSINLGTAVGPDNRTSNQLSTSESSKRAIPPNYEHQRNPPKLEHSRHDEHCPIYRPVSEDTGAKLKPYRRKYSIRRVRRYVPSHRPGLVEANGCGFHSISRPRLTDHPATLDGLPTELKLIILKYIPDLRSLDALIRASPLFSRAYFDVQEEIFNKQTFMELERRGIHLLPHDIDSPRLLAWLEVSIIGGGPPPPDLGPALFEFYNGLETGKSTRLSMSHCKALLTVSDLIGWKRLRFPRLQEGPAFTFDAISLREKREQLIYCPLEKLQTAYTRGVAHYHIYVFRFLKSHRQHFNLSEIEIFRKIFALASQKVFHFGPHRTNPVGPRELINRNLNEAQSVAVREVGTKFALYAWVKKG